MACVDGPRRRLVVCDDDASVRRVVGMLAEGVGYEVVGEAATAIEAEWFVAHTHPHVLVLDLALQGISGLDVIVSIRASAPETAIIVFTAFDSMGAAAGRAGAFAVVAKDEPDRLEDALQRARTSSRATPPP
jgi:CheY-like chemotaxis protein